MSFGPPSKAIIRRLGRLSHNGGEQPSINTNVTIYSNKISTLLECLWGQQGDYPILAGHVTGFNFA